MGGLALGRVPLLRSGLVWRRCRTMNVGGCEAKVYQADTDDGGHLSVIVGYEPTGWHLSISHRTNEAEPRPDRYPTWDEVADARERFLPDALTFGMVLPPRAEYVNLHQTTFHLWEMAS